jgi:hypothetical protein
MQWWRYLILIYTYFVMTAHFNSGSYIARVLRVLAVGVKYVRVTKVCRYH